jgi:hypothetical protein
MKFAELLTKVTLGGENQEPSIEKMKQGYDIAIKAQQQIKEEKEYEAGIVCRVVNGNKVKKRKVKQESELSEIAEK